MIYLLFLIIFILGLSVGSFLNCLIYFLEKGRSSLKGRSFCPKCKHQLKVQDLIPFFSFFILKGKCRYCREKISWQYPSVELTTGIIFFLIAYNFPNFLFSTFYFLISIFLVVIFVYDLKHYIIPDKIVYPAIGAVFFYQIFRSLESVNWDLLGIWNLEFGILNPILTAISVSALFLAIVLLSQGRWMGVGDVKLAFLMGLFLGFPDIIVALFSAFLFGAIIGLGLIFFGKKTIKSELPFGPFLVSGTFLALFWGKLIINWYLKFFIFL